MHISIRRSINAHINISISISIGGNAKIQKPVYLPQPACATYQGYPQILEVDVLKKYITQAEPAYFEAFPVNLRLAPDTVWYSSSCVLEQERSAKTSHKSCLGDATLGPPGPEPTFLEPKHRCKGGTNKALDLNDQDFFSAGAACSGAGNDDFIRFSLLSHALRRVS